MQGLHGAKPGASATEQDRASPPLTPVVPNSTRLAPPFKGVPGCSAASLRPLNATLHSMLAPVGGCISDITVGGLSLDIHTLQSAAPVKWVKILAISTDISLQSGSDLSKRLDQRRSGK